MSVLLNCGWLSQPESSARLQIMVDEKRSKESGKVDDRVAEALARQPVAVGEVDAQRVTDEDPSQKQCEDEIHRAAHADDVGQQARGKENQGVEQHLQARVRLAVGD